VSCGRKKAGGRDCFSWPKKGTPKAKSLRSNWLLRLGKGFCRNFTALICDPKKINMLTNMFRMATVENSMNAEI
jgi:hypothetical protein